MSSTNRGGIRQVSDYYVTPIEIISDLLRELDSIIGLSSDMRALDPCAGGDLLHDMSYPKALSPYTSNITTLDIREDSRAEIKADYLKFDFPFKFDLIITNPPFSHALPIIKKAFTDVKPKGYIVMLLRLNFFGSQARFSFWQDHLPLYCFVHHRRLSFTDDNKADSIEYMHAVWQTETTNEFTKLKVI